MAEKLDPKLKRALEAIDTLTKQKAAQAKTIATLKAKIAGIKPDRFPFLSDPVAEQLKTAVKDEADALAVVEFSNATIDPVEPLPVEG